MVNRLVWIVKFDQVAIRVHMPSQQKNAGRIHTRVKPPTSNFVVYIDGKTGKYLGAGSIAPEDASPQEAESAAPKG